MPDQERPSKNSGNPITESGFKPKRRFVGLYDLKTALSARQLAELIIADALKEAKSGDD